MCLAGVFDCIKFPSFTHTTGMTHFLEPFKRMKDKE